MKVDTDKAKDIDEEVEFEAIFQPKKLWVFRWSTIDMHSLPETPKKVDGANASHGGWLIRAPPTLPLQNGQPSTLTHVYLATMKAFQN